MTPTVVQRWRERRESYRPAGEPIDTRAYEVAEIPGNAEARAFVERHHYEHSFPAARRRFGLYRGAQLAGVAVFSVPVNQAVIAAELGVPANDGTELGRLVLLDDVPANGETWFLGRCFAVLRKDFAGVISRSDPFPRSSLDGNVVKPGHIGVIYQAFNGVYRGKTRPRWIYLLPDGTLFSERAITKVRARDRGWRYSAAILERFGAAPLGEHDDARAWLALWLARLTRKVWHTGHHRYAWGFTPAVRRQLVSAGRYPKKDQPS